MELLDLPIEVLKLIVSEMINVMTFRRANRLRQLNSPCPFQRSLNTR